jgi:hypothetical protein
VGKGRVDKLGKKGSCLCGGGKTVTVIALYSYSQRWQASPSYPAKHRQYPDSRSHKPALLHSAIACATEAVAENVGTSTQARSLGHVPKEVVGGRGGGGVVVRKK